MTRVLLGVRGMDHEAAVQKVTRALLAVPGVARVSATADEQASVEYDATEVTVMELIRALRRIGFLAGME
ncbi:MAG: heavy-metal-associated domain-containing protein [Truepera sp.]|nr:heavy-metal-associated domain-containing protein [Truepera sp.]